MAGGNSTAAVISNSYNTGTVNGATSIGGLAGENYGSLTNTYNVGAVTGQSDYIGGLTGRNWATGVITNSYNNGFVSTTGIGSNLGGLVGNNASGCIITNSF